MRAILHNKEKLELHLSYRVEASTFSPSFALTVDMYAYSSHPEDCKSLREPFDSGGGKAIDSLLLSLNACFVGVSAGTVAMPFLRSSASFFSNS
jgi:hypothetical protein